MKTVLKRSKKVKFKGLKMLLKLHFKTLFFWHSIFLSAKHVNFLHIQTAAFAPLSWVFYANSELFRIFAFFGFCVASNTFPKIRNAMLDFFKQVLPVGIAEVIFLPHLAKTTKKQKESPHSFFNECELSIFWYKKKSI